MKNDRNTYEKVITPPGRLSVNRKELWNYRELIYFFAWRDIKIKYKQTLLGFLWAVLQPLIMALIFTAVIGKAIQQNSSIDIPYPVFILSGMMLWNFFSSSLSNAAQSMVLNASIIKKIYFPRLIIPLSSIITAGFDFLMTLVILIPFLLYFQTPVYLHVVYTFPLAICITILSSAGLGMLISAMNIKYRDFRYVIPFLIQALFFLTPVIYPANITDNRILLLLLYFNPMASAIELFRMMFMPEVVISIEIWISMAMALLFFFAGLLYFKKTEYYFADLV